jgi:hypothetical protein
MIGIIFALTFLLLLMLQLAFTDAATVIKSIAQDVDEAFGYDPLVYPDTVYQNETTY